MNDVHPGWEWANHQGQKMINNVVSTIQVDLRLQCMLNCTLSATCDSYNYRPSDKTCELNTHDTPLIANSADIVSDSAWTWWSPTFCNVVWATLLPLFSGCVQCFSSAKHIFMHILHLLSSHVFIACAPAILSISEKPASLLISFCRSVGWQSVYKLKKTTVEKFRKLVCVSWKTVDVIIFGNIWPWAIFSTRRWVGLLPLSTSRLTSCYYFAFIEHLRFLFHCNQSTIMM